MAATPSTITRLEERLHAAYRQVKHSGQRDWSELEAIQTSMRAKQLEDLLAAKIFQWDQARATVHLPGANTQAEYNHVFARLQRAQPGSTNHAGLTLQLASLADALAAEAPRHAHARADEEVVDWADCV
jgi:hypothetical protein